MFDNLTRKLGLALNRLAGRTTLTAGMLDDALAEVRTALLEADASLPVVKKLVADVREKALGEKIVEKTTPAETVIKIVHDELAALLGGTRRAEGGGKDFGGGRRDPGKSGARGKNIPRLTMLVGLQGTGKTTTAGKLALHYKNQEKKVLLASTDIYRPGAREQLKILADQTGVDSLPAIPNESVAEITARIKQFSIINSQFSIIIDTAGRLQIDDALMGELAEIKAALTPDEILLTADAMAGQESLNVARGFNERIGITGLVMTRADGDARGGAVLSMLAETGAPVLWVGTGEKMDALDEFHAERAAGRILGMGDVVGLVERAQKAVSEQEAEDTMKKMLSGKFDLNTMKWQMEKMKKMGPIGGLLNLIPGLGGMAAQLKDKINDGDINRQLAILRSMTNSERSRPDAIFASRKERIARGSGTSVRDVESLLKRFAQMKAQMKILGPMMPKFRHGIKE